MRTLTMLRAAMFGLATIIAAPALPAPAHAQLSTILETPAPSSAEAAAVADGTVPGWYRRVGEGAFSLREPGQGVYFIVGGHAGFADSTRLRDADGCDHPQAFFTGCETERPSDSLGTGGGGSIGIGTRLTPAVRVALIATGETGYRFHGSWFSPALDETFTERFSVRSYQGTANIYLDVAGLLPPGVLGGFNPYVMSGIGVAFNTTSRMTETEDFGGGVTATNTYPGGTEESLVWTVGGGLQYRVAPGVVADVSYQYVDAGRFTAASGRPQIAGVDGLPFDPPFRAIRGDLETHRVGFAVNIELEAIGRWLGRRP